MLGEGNPRSPHTLYETLQHAVLFLCFEEILQILALCVKAHVAAHMHHSLSHTGTWLGPDWTSGLVWCHQVN